MRASLPASTAAGAARLMAAEKRCHMSRCSGMASGDSMNDSNSLCGAQGWEKGWGWGWGGGGGKCWGRWAVGRLQQRVAGQGCARHMARPAKCG